MIQNARRGYGKIRALSCVGFRYRFLKIGARWLAYSPVAAALVFGTLLWGITVKADASGDKKETIELATGISGASRFNAVDISADGTFGVTASLQRFMVIDTRTGIVAHE